MKCSDLGAKSNLVYARRFGIAVEDDSKHVRAHGHGANAFYGRTNAMLY